MVAGPRLLLGGHLVGATSEERLRNRRHLDPMLAHLRDPRRWSRISHTAALSPPPHLCADIALIGPASPFQAPQDLPLSALGSPKIGNMEFRLSFNKWRKLRPRESQHAQDYTRSQPGDPPSSDPLGKAAPSPLLEAREPPTGLHGDQKALEPGRWGLVSCVSNKNNKSITSFILFLLFI